MGNGNAVVERDEQMVHLLALLDDASPKVRAAVVKALKAYDDLDEALASADATDEQIAMAKRLTEEEPASTEQLFQIGQIVKHKRYGYRGVVVSVDSECQASEDWYQGNRTQPDREQPWYHVLADGSDQVFYPAQTSLEADESVDAVDNPYVKQFFSEFLEGVYVRNDKPFPAEPGSEK